MTETFFHHSERLLLLVAIVIYIRYRRTVNDKLNNCLLAFSVLLTGAMFALPVLLILREFLSFLQFPWRLLLLSTVTIALFLVRCLVKINDEKLTFRVLLISCLIGLYTIGFRYAYQVYVNCRGDAYLESVNPGISAKYHLTYDRNAADMMYLPKESYPSTYESLGDVPVSNHEDVQTLIRREKDTVIMTVKNEKYNDLAVQVPLYMYKGYTATDPQSGQSIPVTKGDLGLVEVNVPRSPDEQMIEIKYSGTLVQRISEIISLIAVLLALYFLFRRRKELSK